MLVPGEIVIIFYWRYKSTEYGTLFQFILPCCKTGLTTSYKTDAILFFSSRSSIPIWTCYLSTTIFPKSAGQNKPATSKAFNLFTSYFMLYVVIILEFSLNCQSANYSKWKYMYVLFPIVWRPRGTTLPVLRGEGVV